MKFIDKNGKLFGEISIIDLVIILCIILIGLFAFLKMSVNDNILFPDKEEYLVTYKLSNVKNSLVDSFYLNDKVYNGDTGTFVGTIEKIETSPALIETTSSGKIVTYTAPERYDVLITICHEGLKNDQKGIVITADYDVQMNLRQNLYTRFAVFSPQVIDIKTKN